MRVDDPWGRPRASVVSSSHVENMSFSLYCDHDHPITPERTARIRPEERTLPAKSGLDVSRTAAKVTQADVARAIRAAQQTGAHGVEIRRDGSIFISLAPSTQGAEKPDSKVEPDLEIVL